MAIASSQCVAVGRIVRALGLEYVRSLRITMEAGSDVTVVSEQFSTADQLGRLAGELETKEWVLVPKDDWERANEAK